MEVFDTSLPEDREEKAAVYARFGVPEYWIVNVRERNLEVRRAPTGEGWGQHFVVEGSGIVSPLDLQATVQVAELLLPLS